MQYNPFRVTREMTDPRPVRRHRLVDCGREHPWPLCSCRACFAAIKDQMHKERKPCAKVS